VTCRSGNYQIVQGLEIDDFCHGKIAVTDAELREERAGVAELL
jgi:malate dehydrogenase